MDETSPDWWAHVRAAVAEGLCPRCGGPLQPAPYHPLAAMGCRVGWCPECKLYYWACDANTGFGPGSELAEERHDYQRENGLPIT